jgi:hypothetical protein
MKDGEDVLWVVVGIYSSDFLMSVGTWEDLWVLVIGHQRRCTESHYESRLGDRYLRNLKVRGCEYKCKSFTISIMQFCFENFSTRTASIVQMRATLSKFRCERRFAHGTKLILDILTSVHCQMSYSSWRS